jgi:hypothetical protein
LKVGTGNNTKTHEKCDYKDIFILISKTLTSDVKAKKNERVVKKKRMLILYNYSRSKHFFYSVRISLSRFTL